MERPAADPDAPDAVSPQYSGGSPQYSVIDEWPSPEYWPTSSPLPPAGSDHEGPHGGPYGGPHEEGEAAWLLELPGADEVADEVADQAEGSAE